VEEEVVEGVVAEKQEEAEQDKDCKV